MEELDKEYLKHPEKGVLRMCDFLVTIGYIVGIKRTRRLLRKMGIDAICPKRNLSKPGKAKYIKPYLLRGLKIERPNQVWAIDITYISMVKGYLYLTAIIDIYSRYIVGWGLYNTIEAKNCIEVLNSAVSHYGTPEIINSDQGSQFTSKEWIEVVEVHKIQISMDCKGRAIYNIFIERFWRTIKYEYIYPRNFGDGAILAIGIKKWMRYYNEERYHSSLGKRTTPMGIFSSYIGESNGSSRIAS